MTSQERETVHLMLSAQESHMRALRLGRARSATEWVVGVEQRKPYEFLQLEIFTDESDAIRFAESQAACMGGINLSKRRWRLSEDGHVLGVFKR